MEIIEKENPALVPFLTRIEGAGAVFRMLQLVEAPGKYFWALANSVVKDGVWEWDECDILYRMVSFLDENGEEAEEDIVNKVEEGLKNFSYEADNWARYEGASLQVMMDYVVANIEKAVSLSFKDPEEAADTLDSAAGTLKEIAEEIRNFFSFLNKK